MDVIVHPIMSISGNDGTGSVIKGAGEIITDYQGKDVLKGNSVIAASPAIHSEVIKSLN